MTRKVLIDYGQMTELHGRALEIGTLFEWSRLALQWMKAANDELVRLREELAKYQ